MHYMQHARGRGSGEWPARNVYVVMIADTRQVSIDSISSEGIRLSARKIIEVNGCKN